jgi:preprotein translocase subunit YajC
LNTMIDLTFLVLQAAQPTRPRQPPYVFLIYIVFFGLIAWFLLIRPQRKMQETHQQMLSGLKKGDEIVTEGGIIGTILHLGEDRVTIRTGENTRIVVARPKIARVMTVTPAPEKHGEA